MTARVAPPEEHRHHRWHWLAWDERDRFGPCAWKNGQWLLAGIEGGTSPQVMALLGWRYVAPCIPPEIANG